MSQTVAVANLTADLATDLASATTPSTSHPVRKEIRCASGDNFISIHLDMYVHMYRNVLASSVLLYIIMNGWLAGQLRHPVRIPIIADMHSPSCLLLWAAAGIGFRICFFGHGNFGCLGCVRADCIWNWAHWFGKLVRASARESCWVHTYTSLPKYQVTYMYACNVVLCIVLASVGRSDESSIHREIRWKICDLSIH